VEDLRNDLRRLRGRVEAGLAATSDETLTRQWINEAQARAEAMDKELRARGQEQRKERNRASSQRRAAAKSSEAARPHVLGPGDVVFVQSMGSEGDVLSRADSNGQVEVQVGAFKMRVPVSSVTLRRTAQAATTARELASARSPIIYSTSAPKAAPPLEYDFRGWRAEEAIEEMDRRLDEAAVAGMPFLRVIHGKGTGALRKALRDYFQSHPAVKEVETAPQEQGGEGVTIVKL